MQREKIKAIISWALTVLCMVAIFMLSSKTADESSAQSTAILEWLMAHLGDGIFTDFIVRKTAHFLEFTGLALLFSTSLYYTRGRKMPFTAIALTSFYAASDEIHQIFVEGRSCQLIDWVIDTCGAAVGAISFLLIVYIITAVNKRKNTIDR